MFGWFKEKEPELFPISLSGTGMIICDCDTPKWLIERAQEVDKHIGYYTDRLAELQRKEQRELHGVYGHLRLQQCFGSYDPRDDTVQVYFHGAKNLNWAGSRELFLKSSKLQLDTTPQAT